MLQHTHNADHQENCQGCQEKEKDDDEARKAKASTTGAGATRPAASPSHVSASRVVPASTVSATAARQLPEPDESLQQWLRRVGTVRAGFAVEKQHKTFACGTSKSVGPRSLESAQCNRPHVMITIQEK